MMHYESVLNKIAPLFYKLAMYNKFRIDNFHLINQYIRSAKLPTVYYLDLMFSKNISYFYDTDSSNFESPMYTIIVRLTTRNNVDKYADSYMDEFIVNMVINGFSFENDNIVTSAGYEIYFIPYKDLFIAAVGKDLYEALRSSVK